MKQLILFGLAVLVLTNRKRTTTGANTAQTEQPLTTKKTSEIVNTGGTGGGGTGGGGTVETPLYWFTHNQQSFNEGDTQVQVQLVSHSRVALSSGESTGNDNAKCEYWIYDMAGNVIVQMHDDFNAHHPNYFPSSTEYYNQTQSVRDEVARLSSIYVPVNPFTSYESKGNNHLPFFHRYLKAGNYRWYIKNNSNLKTTVFVGYANSETENVQHNFEIEAGSTADITFTVALHPTNAPVPMKINLNNYHR